MKTAVLLLNFGEPENPTPAEVIPFLERIFALNAPLLGGSPTPDEVRARSRRLAEERAPGLMEEYLEIGGSPLHAQARDQAEGLGRELARRGIDALVLVGMQFTDPPIEAAVARARDEGADQLVALPVYPLAGPSTTVAALDAVDRAVADLGWGARVHRIAGWHRHPDYIRLRATALGDALTEAGLSLDDPGTRLVFSAHGTPLKYIEEGSGYQVYVEDFCRRLAAEVGAPRYTIGYQNHTNRPGVRWTQPDVDRVIAEIEASAVIVDPVSFMHEQSETLAELDHELREQAESRGIEFHRVRIRHADPLFLSVLADLVEPFARRPSTGSGDAPVAGGIPLHPCVCNPVAGTFCMNPPLRG